MPKIISISKIKSDPNQPRKTFEREELKFLAESIKSGGQINPILLDENYRIIVGERRYKALKLANIKKLVEGEHFRIKKGLTKLQKMKLQSDEDAHDKSIPLEERDKFWYKIFKEGKFEIKRKLADFLNVRESDIGDAFDRLGIKKLVDHKLDVAPSTITETKGLPMKERIQLLKTAERKDIGARKIRSYVETIKIAPESIKKEVIRGKIEPEVAREIIKIDKPEIQREVLREVEALQKRKKVEVTPEGIQKIKKDIETYKALEEWKNKLKTQIKQRTPEDYIMNFVEALQGTWSFMAVERANRERIREIVVKNLTLKQLEEIESVMETTKDELEEFYEMVKSEISLRKARIK